MPGALLAFAGVVLFTYFFTAVPLPAAVGMEPTVILDQAGREVATLQPEASREDIALDALPDHVPQAVLAAEDAGFYRHPGVSLAGIFRAAFVNVTSGRVTQGGSTISQQYIKNVTADSERTTMRKIREAALAVKLEREFSKDEILEFYLNTIYFGRGAYGIQAASRAYFDKPATELTVAEAAQLAGIIPAPSAMDPLEHPDRAHGRYRYVLDRLVEEGWLGPGEAAHLRVSPPQVQDRRSVAFKRAPHFLGLVQRELGRRLGDEQVYRGLRVTTTLDLGVQDAAEAAFREGFQNLGPTGALVALDPGTGGIRALVGGREGEQINLAVDSRRQPGSTFKPFALAAWVESGKSPESFFAAPAELRIEDPSLAEPWEVGNYGGQGFGRMTLREGTWRSVNTVYAQVAMELGGPTIAELAQRAGIRRDFQGHPSIVLGAEEVSPLELATAYNTLASGGLRHSPIAVLRVERGGTLLYEAPIREQRAFSEQVAWTVTDVLRGVIGRGTGGNADIGRPAAGKTGTTQNYGNAWFAGYTPHLTAVVWMGNRDSNEAMPERPTGSGVPATVWARFMSTALAGVAPADFPEPSGSLDVVGPTPEPTEDTGPPECPEGQQAVRVEEEGDPEAGDPAWVCVEATPTPDATATPTEEPTESPTLAPLPSRSPSPSPSPSPASPSPSPTQDEPSPSPSPTGTVEPDAD